METDPGDNITAAIRAVVQASGPKMSFTETAISALSLRTGGGGMDLLMAPVDPDNIRLVGRWRSDTMLRNLHMTAKRITEGISAKMFKHGAYVIIPPAHAVN